MWQIITNREGLLRHLGAGKQRSEQLKAVNSPGGPIRLDKGDLALLWEGTPNVQGELPEVLVVADGEVRAFLAWASTYLDGFRPFTSLCRVMDLPTFCSIRDAEPPTQFNLVGAACAVTVLADALTQSRGRVDENMITIAACQSTYSFVRARMLICGLDARDNVVRQNWNLARDIARQPSRFVSPDATDSIWKALDLLCNPNARDRSGSALFLLLSEYAKTGTISDRLASMTGLTSIRDIAREMEESRERRVVVLDDVLQGHILGDSTDFEREIIRGYVASLLSPGTVEYFGLISSYLVAFPTLLMWYAVFAGLHPQTRVLSQFGGLCRRILRDIEQREMLFDRPRCDIAVEEMEVLATIGPKGLNHIRGGIQGPIRIEIYPTITAPIRVSPTATAEQPTLFEHAAKVATATSKETDADADVATGIGQAISILQSLKTKMSSRNAPGDSPVTEKRKRKRR